MNTVETRTADMLDFMVNSMHGQESQANSRRCLDCTCTLLPDEAEANRCQLCDKIHKGE